MKLEDLTNIYVVCSVNTCRSPMAQRILMELLPGKNIQSRRSYVNDTPQEKTTVWGEDITQEAANVIMKKYGDEAFCKNHKSKVFLREELKNADIVITMGGHQKNQLICEPEAHMPDGYCKVYTLGELAGKPTTEVSDPWGGADIFDGYCGENDIVQRFAYDQAYEATFIQIRNLLREAMTRDIPLQKMDKIPDKPEFKVYGFTPDYKPSGLW
jgi:protein arginine phosphatase